MQWPIVLDVIRAVARRAMPVLLAALIGAMADAGLLDGAGGRLLVDVLPVSSFRLSAAPVESPHHLSLLGKREQGRFEPVTDRT
jgi:hypothetical protein